MAANSNAATHTNTIRPGRAEASQARPERRGFWQTVAAIQARDGEAWQAAAVRRPQWPADKKR